MTNGQQHHLQVEGMTFNDGEREFASSNKVNKTYEQMLAELEGLDLSEGAEKIHIQRIGTPPKFSHKERLMVRCILVVTAFLHCYCILAVTALKAPTFGGWLFLTTTAPFCKHWAVALESKLHSTFSNVGECIHFWALEDPNLTPSDPNFLITILRPI